MNVCGVTFGGYLAKKLSFKLGNLLYKSNFYLLSEDTVQYENLNCVLPGAHVSLYPFEKGEDGICGRQSSVGTSLGHMASNNPEGHGHTS